MSTPSSPPPPDGPNLSPHGKWGVAPSSSPQMTRASDKMGLFPALWWLLAVAVVIVVTIAIAWLV
ncbi:hypothetical protein [Mycobacterium kubicae]|uniref:hypothetical protein n=1 Tax=Mycobacterium kubicae TaxID=120959 RepID=UPI000A8BCD8D|nr:hypothetical protein [Mycobacterium kubicae]QNI07562.1 hypothetical protein GAN17_15625 [Mycobacterium kubicae]